MENELCFGGGILLPEDTTVHQTDDGTFYYHKHSSPQRLYVKSRGKDVDIQIPEEPIFVHSNHHELCFATEEKIFKVEFASPDNISVVFIRDKLEDEVIHPMGVCSRKRINFTYFYLMSDDPDTCSIVVNTDISKMELRGIYCQNVIFSTDTSGDWSALTCDNCEDNEYTIANAIILKIEPGYVMSRSFSRFSSFLYFTNGRCLVTLDTANWKFLPSLYIDIEENVRMKSFVGVHDGNMIIESYNFQLMTAELPDDYFKFSFKEQWLDIRQVVTQLKKIKQSEEILEKENEDLILKIRKLEELLIENKVDALQTAKKSLRFQDVEKLTKPLICIQLENGTTMYFDNVKPFELFTMEKESPQNVDIALLEGEFDCSFRGVIDNHAYFSTVRGKIIKFFKTTNENGIINLEQINEMKTSEISLFNNEPLYFIERSREWSVFHYHENYTKTEGEKFDISEIDLLSKYERHYHRGVLYLFRETAKAAVKRVNEKVVKVEGPLLEFFSFYTTPHSDFIYILNSEQSVLLILDTTNLHVSQMSYEPFADSNNHSIVGIHDGVLTMAFDGIWGRHLSTTIMP